MADTIMTDAIRTDAVALWLGERLLIGSLQGALVIALVWLICRLVPRIPAAAQAALWWLAALKLVLMVTPVPALPVVLLSAAVSAEAILDGTPEGVPTIGRLKRCPTVDRQVTTLTRCPMVARGPMM